jgi:hypothetical protein
MVKIELIFYVRKDNKKISQFAHMIAKAIVAALEFMGADLSHYEVEILKVGG